MPRRLPPLKAIRAFESSARHGGFVGAANELGVTPVAGRLIAPLDVRLQMPSPSTLVTPRSAWRKRRIAGLITAPRTIATQSAG